MTDQTEGGLVPGDENWEKLEPLLQSAMEAANNGDFEGAVTVCRDAVTAFPKNAEPYFILAVLAMNHRDEGQAISMAETAHKIDPDTKEYVQVLATISTRVGRLADGIYYAKIALACEPHPYLGVFVPPNLLDFDAAINNAGPSLHGIEGERFFNEANYGAAFREFNAEIRLNPENTTALVWLAKTGIILGHFNQSIGALQAALRVEPGNAMALAQLARALVRVGRMSEAAAIANSAIAGSTGDCEVFLPAMEALQLCGQAGSSELKRAAKNFSDLFEAENEPEPLGAEHGADGDVARIGFMSNAFFRSNISEIIAGWFAIPKSNKVNVSGYSQSVASDNVTIAIRSGCDDWRDIYGIDPFTLSMTMRAEELDVIVDISQIDGETRGAVIGLLPAPIRVGFSALPEPGLAPGITHVLSDEALAAADQNMLLDGQELITVPGTLFPHLPLNGLAQDTKAPGHSSNKITFAAFASLPNVSQEWALSVGRIVGSLPNAELLLFGAHALSDYARSIIREYFMNAGIIERVFFTELPTKDDSDVLSEDYQINTIIPGAHWAEVDVFLDTFPFNGRKETCEALWSGVPTVTLKGQRRTGSIGASLLMAAGRPTWIAESTDEYEDIVARLVGDTERLQAERAMLQSMIASTPLFDPLKTASAIRAALVTVADQARSGRA
ncbi:tetratricopeptide repeat protein [Rhodospirillales bacterium]|nr:tetratricopeptide repeat protein [Rhodospirillales bacterium]